MNRYMIVIPAKNRSFVLKCDEGDGAKLETLQKLVSGYAVSYTHLRAHET